MFQIWCDILWPHRRSAGVEMGNPMCGFRLTSTQAGMEDPSNMGFLLDLTGGCRPRCCFSVHVIGAIVETLNAAHGRNDPCVDVDSWFTQRNDTTTKPATGHPCPVDAPDLT